MTLEQLREYRKALVRVRIFIADVTHGNNNAPSEIGALDYALSRIDADIAEAERGIAAQLFRRGEG